VVIAAVVAAVTAILGILIPLLQTRKAIAEIHKIELEAKKLREQTDHEVPVEYQEHRISISNSDGNNIRLLVDPRFAAPF
jgi:hypothetical protein